MELRLFMSATAMNDVNSELPTTFPKRDFVSGLPCVSMQNQETKALKAETFETKHETMRHA